MARHKGRAVACSSARAEALTFTAVNPAAAKTAISSRPGVGAGRRVWGPALDSHQAASANAAAGASQVHGAPLHSARRKPASSAPGSTAAIAGSNASS